MVHSKRQQTSDFSHFKLYPKFVGVTHLNRSKSQHFQYVLPESLELFVYGLFQLNRPTGFYSSNPTLAKKPRLFPDFGAGKSLSFFALFEIGIKLIYGRS